MKSQPQRVQWVDVVKYICIMWVMLSHLEANTELLGTFYNPIFLNGFSFVSGYVYFRKDRFNKFFLKKVKGLFIPWLIFSVLNIVLAQIITFAKHASLSEELKWNFLQIRGRGDGIWYVAALFVAFIPFYFFIEWYEKSEKYKKDRIIFILIALFGSLMSSLYSKYMKPNILPWGTASLPWHIEYIFIAMFWMFLGYMFRAKYEKKFDLVVKPIDALVVFVIYIVIRYLPFICDYEIKNDILSIFYSYVSELIGVFILIFVSKKIPVNKYLLYIGQNTLICFALHGKIYSMIQAVLKRTMGLTYTNVLANTLCSSVFAIIFTIVLSFILIGPIYVINRCLPFLIGRRYERREGYVREQK